MILKQDKINNIKFFYREGYSDIKTFVEVIQKKTYLKKNMKILPNETWMDCGGNVGAFTLLACSLGANVTVYEPDPYNCEMINKNLKLNGFTAEIKQAALVHNNIKEITIIEIKPRFKMHEEANVNKVISGKEYARVNNMIFEYWSEKDIYNLGLNIKEILIMDEVELLGI